MHRRRTGGRADTVVQYRMVEAGIILILFLYYFSFAMLMIYSWRRSRSILHPHFMFCAMLTVFASDFMVRGYDDPNLDWIQLDVLYRYQLMTLAVMIGAGLLAGLVRQPYERNAIVSAARMTHPGKQTITLIFAVAALILTLEVLKRLDATGWSLTEVVRQMLGPRGFRDWDVDSDIGRNNAPYQLISAMLPLAGICCAYVLFWGDALRRLGALFFYLVAIAILITDGSRTQCIIAIAAFALFGVTSARNAAARAGYVGSTLVAIALATSAMISHRGAGFSDTTSAPTQNGTLVYHQDDSLYRAWAASAYADHSSYRWDPVLFFENALVSPVPRKLWPGKPLLDQDFYGAFKLYFVTTLFIGEWVAMAGVAFGMIFSLIFVLLLYRVFYAAQRLLTLPLGITAYLLIALYVYQVMRSMPNLSSFIYAPAAALLLTVVATRLSRKQLTALPGPVRVRPS